MGAGKTRTARALNSAIIKSLRADPAGPYRIRDTRCKGLAVRVATNGGKTWDLAFRLKKGRVRRVSLGDVDDLGLEAAHERANALTSAARQGRDLLAQEAQAHDEAERAFTVEKLVEEYLRRRVRGRLKSARRIENRLKRTLAPIFKHKAAEIRRRDLRVLFDDAADAGHGVEAETRRLTVQTMFSWAAAQDILETSPASGLTAYGPKKTRDRTLSDDEILALWQWRGLPAAMLDVLKLQLLLGARVSEIGGMRADEITIDAGGKMLWTLTPERAKNSRARATPLIGLAAEILGARLAIGQPLLFGVQENTLGKRLRRSGRGFRTHDLRRTAAFGLAELAPLDTVAAILGHAGDKDTKILVKHYLRSDLVKRKELALLAWDARVREIVADEPPAADERVVELNRARR